MGEVSRLGVWLFLGFASLYLLLGTGRIASPDGVVMSRVTTSLLEGRTDIQPLENWPAFGGSLYYDEGASTPRFYAKYGLGQSLAAIPSLLVGRALEGLVAEFERGSFDTPIGVVGTPSEVKPFGDGNPFRVRWYDASADAWPVAFDAWAMSWTNAWVVAAIVALLFGLGCELGFGVRPSLAMALLAGLATPLSHYARTFFSEPLAALGLVAFLLLLVRASRRERGSAAWAGAGAALGVAVLAKITHAVLLVPGGLLVLAFLWRRARATSTPLASVDSARSLGVFCLGLCVPLACIAGYDFARFGDVFETGYAAEVDQWTTPFLEGFTGLLWSSGKGLLWFSPLVVAAVFYGPRFARRFPLECAFVGLSLASLLLLYARWYMWEGGWCWGPRFLVPVIPLLMLPVGALLSQMPRRSAAHAAFGALAATALVVSASSLFVDFIDFHNWVKLTHGFQVEAFTAAGAPNYYDLVRWDWQFSPLVANWSFPIRDGFLLPHLLAAPGWLLGMHAGFAFGVGISGWRIAALLTHTDEVEELSGSEAVAVR